MAICPECYSDKPRITPLLQVQHCLQDHRQYICSRCGRIICAEVDELGKYRARFPFKTLQIAKYYLRAAEVIHKSVCEIYELQDTFGRTVYRIFKDRTDLETYLEKNPNRQLAKKNAVYVSPVYKSCGPDQLRYLKPDEIQQYLAEKGVK